MTLFSKLVLLAATTLLIPTPGNAEEPIRVGFISTLSGPGGAIGADMLRAFQLGLEESGGKLGGHPAQLFTGDDQAKPQVAVQVVREKLEQDHVDLVTGPAFSNAVDAMIGPVAGAGHLLVAPLGGSSASAGEKCNPNFFMVSWNTDTIFEVLGDYLKKQDTKRVALVAQNFQGGWDAIAGFKKGFGEAPVAELLVPIEQSEFAAELSQLRVARPQALVTFLPGGTGISFTRQFYQAGLQRSIKSYAATIQADQLTFSALGPAAIGMMVVGNWTPDLTVAANEAFVTAFRKKYGNTPSIQAAMSYDTFKLLDRAVADAGDTFRDPAKLRDALVHAKFDSVRGKFGFSTNHFPIQNFYLAEVVKDAAGNPQTRYGATIATDRADSHVAQCPLK